MRTRRGARALPLLAIAQLISPSLVVGQGVPRFEIATSPIQLEGPARPGIYLGGVGREAAFFGQETGAFEAWAWPAGAAVAFTLAMIFRAQLLWVTVLVVGWLG